MCRKAIKRQTGWGLTALAVPRRLSACFSHGRVPDATRIEERECTVVPDALPTLVQPT